MMQQRKAPKTLTYCTVPAFSDISGMPNQSFILNTQIEACSAYIAQFVSDITGIEYTCSTRKHFASVIRSAHFIFYGHLSNFSWSYS